MPKGFKRKEVLKCWLSDLGQWMILTFDIHTVSEKSTVLPFFQYKSIRDQIWPCYKIGQGQPRVIIWINLVVLEHPMLHTKFQSHQLFGSGEEDFWRFLPYMAMAEILFMRPWPFEQTFIPSPHKSSIRNLTLIGPVVSEEKMFEECGRRTTTNAYLYYKLTSEPWRLPIL